MDVQGRNVIEILGCGSFASFVAQTRTRLASK